MGIVFHVGLDPASCFAQRSPCSCGDLVTAIYCEESGLSALNSYLIVPVGHTIGK